MNLENKDIKSNGTYISESITDITETYTEIISKLNNKITPNLSEEVYRCFIVNCLYRLVNYEEYGKNSVLSDFGFVTVLIEMIKRIVNYSDSDDSESHDNVEIQKTYDDIVDLIIENIYVLIDTINNSLSDVQNGKIKLTIVDDKLNGKINLVIKIYSK